MKSALKIFTVVTISMGISFSAWGFEHHGLKNPTFKRLKKRVWYQGIKAPSKKNIFDFVQKLPKPKSRPGVEKATQPSWKHRYPEELVYPLLKLSKFST